MALWFSASAVLPALAAEFQPFELRAGGAHERRAGGIRRRLPRERAPGARRPGRSAPVLRACRRRSRALANALLLVVDPASLVAPALRVVTGVCMAGVYPVGMKLASTWAKGDMGLMVGILVGALTLGLRVAASVQRDRRHRLARSAGDGVGQRRSPRQR